MKSKKRRCSSCIFKLEKTANDYGNIAGYPCIESIFDSFGIVVHCIERFEASLRPTSHIAMPAVYRIMQKLDDVSCGKMYDVEKANLLLTRRYIHENCSLLGEIFYAQ